MFSNQQIGNFIEAINDYTQTIELQPDDADAFYNRSIANHQIHNNQESTEDISSAISLYSQQGDTKSLERARKNTEKPSVKTLSWSESQPKKGKRCKRGLTGSVGSC